MKDSMDIETIIEKSSNLSINKYFLYCIMFLIFIFLALFVKLKSYGYIDITIFLLLGLSIFIITSNKFTQSPKPIIQVQSKLPHVCLSMFFITFAFSIVYLRFLESFYSKSLWYYFFIGICTSLIFVISISIGENPIKKLLPYLTSIFGLCIYLSNFIVFPNGTYASGDTHYQIYNIILPIIENGHVPSSFSYFYFPIHQLLVASLAIITGIEPVFVYLSLTSLLYAVSALFVYLIISRAGASRYGITAMLLFITSSTIYYHSTHAFQFSYALPLGILLMYITIVLTIPDNYNKNQNLIEKRESWALIHVLAIGTLILTHQFTSTMVFILILILEITDYIISNNKLSFYGTIFFLYIIALIGYWIYVSFLLSTVVMVFDVYFNSLFSPENYQTASSILYSSYIQPDWLSFADMSGRGIIMMLGLIGFLYGMWKKNKYVFLWFTIGAFIWILVSVGSFIQMPLLLGTRLLSFFDAMSIVFLATFGIMLLIERFGTKGLILCSIFFLVLPIFSLGSTLSGSETSLFAGDQPYIKFYDTNADLQYRTWIKSMVPSNSNILVSESWVPQYLDNVRIYDQLPINDHDQVVDNDLISGEYVALNKHDSMGVRVKGISEEKQIKLVRANNISTVEAQKSHIRMLKLDISEIKRVTSQLKHIYSNGETDVCLK